MPTNANDRIAIILWEHAMRLSVTVDDVVIEDPVGEIVELRRLDDLGLLKLCEDIDRVVAVAPCTSIRPPYADELAQRLEALRTGTWPAEIGHDRDGEAHEPELYRLCRALHARAFAIFAGRVTRTRHHEPEFVLVVAVLRSWSPQLRLRIDLDHD